MFTPAQLEALSAAVDVAFDATPSDDRERLEMEDHARKGLLKAKEIADLPAPSSKRCHLITGSTKGPRILQTVKLVLAADPNRKVVVQPEVDYLRLWAQVNRLEAQYRTMLKKLQDAQDEIEDLQHIPAEYKDAEPDVEAIPVPFPKAPLSAEQIGDAVYAHQDLPKKTPFEAHMERCERCGERGRYRDEPMGVCPVGAALLKKEGTIHA